MDFDDEATVNFQDAASVARGTQCPALYMFHRDGAVVLPLVSGQPKIIGRADTAGQTIRDPSLSRQHARIELNQEKIWIEDLDSTNGTFINGQRIYQRTLVRPGDQIRCGSVTCTIHAPDNPVDIGLVMHDQFMSLLESELARAKSFTRSFALVMVRSSDGQAGSLQQWFPRIHQHLREHIDRMAFYSSDTLELLLPEVAYDEAERIARGIVGGDQGEGPRILCGISLFPADANSADEMLENSLLSVQRATATHPIHFARGYGRTSTSQEHPKVDAPEDEIVAQSRAMQAIYGTVQILARSAIPVLIYGETGSGKEVIARSIHREGDRSSKPFQVINCGAIPETLIESVLFGHERGAFTGAQRQTKGIFEAANGGTVLLDEIGELSLSAQAALLRVLETKRVTRIGSTKEIEVDVRILAATNRDLEVMCDQQIFRRDLFYRLNTMTLNVPPLRDRPEDIGPLVQFFAQRACTMYSFPPPAIHPSVVPCLQRYPWPGNIRELRNVIDRAVVLAQGNAITLEDLSGRIRKQTAMDNPVPAEFSMGDVTNVTMPIRLPTDVLEPVSTVPSMRREMPDFKSRIKRYEMEIICQALQTTRGNKTAAAKALDIPMRTLTHKISAFGLSDTSRGDLPPALPEDERVWEKIRLKGASSFKERINCFESELLCDALSDSAWNKSEAARLLKIPLRTLMHKVKAFGLEP
jgi:DNA-binding NtrC family response regulator